MTERSIAYFSMEIGLDAAMPTYSGGLGVLSGDTVRSAADLKVPMVAVTLLYRKGHFTQKIDPQGHQQELYEDWPVEKFFSAAPQRVSVEIEGRTVHLQAWRHDVRGVDGFVVPVYFLDADLDGNSSEDRALTHFLYGGDQRYRFCQEVILGVGGVRMLRALGFNAIRKFHMNEGHAALLTLELLDEVKGDKERVRSMCSFTTHTPVAAGHDQVPPEMVKKILNRHELFELKEVFGEEGMLNMTYLALNLSGYVNGVSKKHGEVSQAMFPKYPIASITNGVHCATWASPPFQALFDRYAPGWRAENEGLRQVLKIPSSEVWQAHMEAKRALVAFVDQKTGVAMDPDLLTIGFARRFTGYKRPELLFYDVERLYRIAKEMGPLQVLYAGKAHPRDEGGKTMIHRVIQMGRGFHDPIRFAFIENYDLDVAKLLVSGVDLWLNNPQSPLEASGTSGMKAAVNGVPSLSVLDGWWIEGHVEGVTGWAIRPPEDAAALYDKLREVCALYYRHPTQYADVMRHAIAVNATYFNTQRMVQQYVQRAY